MAVRKIHIWPDPVLHETANPVAQFGRQTIDLIRDLFDTMYAANGVGLAATQIGVRDRVLVIDLDPKASAANDEEVKAELESWGFREPMAFVNPEIVSSEGEIFWEEGCLSVPRVTEKIKRREWVEVRALDARGNEFVLQATGLFAVAIQHEIDHLEGRVFVDYLSKLKRDVIKLKMERLKIEADDDGVKAAVL